MKKKTANRRKAAPRPYARKKVNPALKMRKQATTAVRRYSMEMLAAALQGDEPERIEYVRPTPLPGVLPAKLPTKATGLRLATGETPRLALDDAPAAWGGLESFAMRGPGLAFLGFPFLAELAQITEYRTPAETLSVEMTRRWVRLKSKGDQQDAKKKDTHLSKAAQNKVPEPEDAPSGGDDDKQTQKIKAIESRMEELNVRGVVRECILKTEQFGRAHIAINVRGQDGDEIRQMPLTTIEKGSLAGLQCIEPYWMTPYSWNSTRPERKDFYKPQSWFVLGRKTHETRILTMILREVPDLLKPAYDFAGISITQLMMPYVNRWLRTAKNVNDLINIFSIVSLATDMERFLKDPALFKQRLDMFVRGRDNRGILATDKATEELTTNNIPLSSLDKLQAQAQEHMATPGRMPLIKFFGITPTGLNTTSEGEFQSWYDYCHGLQELINWIVKRIIELVQMDLFGSVDPDITFEWLSLYEPTPKEMSELRKADADRDAVLVDRGVVDADEVREKLRRDPDSGYTQLVGNAPEPPAMQEQRLGNELGEETAENAHARSEESAENAHKREQQASKNE